MKGISLNARLENFGTRYLLKQQRTKSRRGRDTFPPDDVLVKFTRRMLLYGMVLAALAGFLSNYLCVWSDLTYKHDIWYVHYAIYGAVLIVCSAAEFYVLLILSLRVVHNLADKTHMYFNTHPDFEDGPLNITSILARAAAVLDDPPYSVLGIDPLEQVSKRNLFILAVFYKVRVIVSMVLARMLLKWLSGDTLLGIPIGFIAAPIGAFWDALVIRQVLHEGRLRVFGYKMALDIAKQLQHAHLLKHVSATCRDAAFRAVANAVVMTQNYHPNMMLLLVAMKNYLGITQPDNYDRWDILIERIQHLEGKEKYTVLDILAIAMAFDGKISKLEKTHLHEAFGDDTQRYVPRIKGITHALRAGRLETAKELCVIDGRSG